MERHAFDTSLITTAERLTDLALSKVLAALRGYGNSISPTHELALRQLLARMSAQALKLDSGRFAYALPCGAGKTQCVVAWIAACHELGLRLSVAVAASQIKALGKIRADLTKAGVPDGVIGLRHSSGNRVEERDTGQDDRQVMLFTHARVWGAPEFPEVCRHQGSPRDLLIWDESLITTNAHTLSWLDVKSAVRRVLPEAQPGSMLRLGLEDARGRLGTEVKAQRAGACPVELSLWQEVDVDSVAAEAKVLGFGRGDMLRAAVDTVRALLRFAERPVTIALTGSGKTGDGLIGYRVAVDPALDNVVVLDASHTVRTLAQGGGIKDGTTEAMRKCKSYECVTVRHVEMATGKSTLRAGSAKTNGKAKAMAARAADIVRSVPPSEHVLIFTFKGDDRKTLQARMQADMRAEGIDLDAMVNGKRQILWLTWGSETSLSEFSHCKHVILAGVLRRHQLDLAAGMAGKKGDQCYRMSPQEAQELSLSEMAHCVLQAMNRGSCRMVDASGKAHAMSLTILARAKGLQEVLESSLPGIQWELEAPTTEPTRTQQTANAMRDHLWALPQDVTKISIVALKKAIGVTLHRDMWREARDHGLLLTVTPNSTSRWRLDGQSVVRIGGD